MNPSTRFQCCFCGQSIKGDAVDPLQLVVSEHSYWDASKSEAENPPTQSLWCHTDCLGDRLDGTVPFLDHAARIDDPGDV